MRPRGRMKIFGIDDVAFGALGGGALNLAGNIFSNFTNQQNSAATNAFNAQQADFGRGFAQNMADTAYDRNVRMANTSMAFGAQEAQKARDYTTMMSNSAYQRQIADMKAAGLNPIMAAMKGGGADTPGSPSPQGVSATQSGGSSGIASAVMPNVRSVMENVISSAREAARAEPEVENLKAERRNKDETNDLIKANVAEVKAREARERSSAKNIDQDTLKKEAETTNEKRRQSQVHVLGSGFNPEALGDKLGPAVQSGWQWFKNSAKSLDRMIRGE